MRSTIINALAAGVVLLNLSCSDEPQEPRERVGAPLSVTPPTSAADGSTARGIPGDGGADSRSEAEAGPAVEAPQPDAAPRPQPARALAKAAEADELAHRGELAKASEAYGAACALNPRSPWMRTAHGWFLARRGQRARARDELERALDLAEPVDPLLLAAIHLGLGELREVRSDRARARESYRMGLRAWSAPPLARALLRVTPADDLQHQAAVKLAFGGRLPPPRLQQLLAKSGGRLEVLDFAADDDGRLALLTAQPPPDPTTIPAGAHYALRLLAPLSEPDAGPGPAPLIIPLVEAPAIRWHQGRLEALELGEGRRGFLITLERTAPGAGAPRETGTTLVGLSDQEPARVLFTRVTGSERDDPLGCRRGWSEEVTLVDPGGDAPEAVTLTRTDFVRPRLETAADVCPERETSRDPQTLPLRPQNAKWGN